MNDLTILCRLLGLEITDYRGDREVLIDNYELVYICEHDWQTVEIEFSHGITITIDQELLRGHDLWAKGKPVPDVKVIGDQLSVIVWQQASEEFKEKLGKAIEFGGKL